MTTLPTHHPAFRTAAVAMPSDLEARSEKCSRDDLPHPEMNIPLRSRLRLRVQGALLMFLGVYIIWKTVGLVLGLFPVPESVNMSWDGWSGMRHIVVLYSLVRGGD
jgi:hypothetical protein